MKKKGSLSKGVKKKLNEYFNKIEKKDVDTKQRSNKSK
jgi:hypothetical protein